MTHNANGSFMSLPRITLLHLKVLSWAIAGQFVVGCDEGSLDASSRSAELATQQAQPAATAAVSSGPVSPSAALDIVISTNTTISATDASFDGNNIFVDGAVLTIDGAHSFNSLRLQNNGRLTHTQGQAGLALTIAGDATIDVGGAIDVTGKGYPGGAGPGAGGSGGTAGGGGHGGAGGAAQGVGGTPYDSLTSPSELGSGGGVSSSGSAGGAGGGRVALSVGGTLTVNGTIAADGADGSWCCAYYTGGGGGSGGSIYLSAGTITGSGSISVRGGAGNGYPVVGGGGGGGRISVYYDTNTGTGTVATHGGSGAQRGGAGTLYRKSSAQVWGELVLDNGGQPGAPTVLPAGPLTLDGLYSLSRAMLEVPASTVLTMVGSTLVLDGGGELLVHGEVRSAAAPSGVFGLLEVKGTSTLTVENGGAVSCTALRIEGGGAVVLNDGAVLNCSQVDVLSAGVLRVNDAASSFAGLHVASGGAVTHDAGDDDFTLSIAGDVTIDVGGAIDVTGKGYPGGAGPGAGGSGGTAGGGGHGGAGGAAQGVGGTPYGSLTSPSELGSGGGVSSSGSAGGAGGGRVALSVGGTLTVNGTIAADGADGSWCCAYYTGGGGGSGGSIYLGAATITGSGSISARGGAGNGYPDVSGGGGGGGRVRLTLAPSAYVGGFSAAGGSGANAGQVGTIYTTPSNHSLLLNKRTIGHLAQAYAGQAWSFSAVAGQQLRLQGVSASAPGVVFDLDGPNGWTGFVGQAGDSVLYTLTETGAYSLVARDTAGVGNITYSFELAETSVTNLLVGTPYAGNFGGTGQAQLFTVVVGGGGPLSIVLDDSAGNNANEIYLKLGSPPTRSDYDYRFTSVSGADQRLVVPTAGAGTWYVLVYSSSTATPSSYTLTARSSPLFLSGVTPDHHTNLADASLTLSGAGFDSSLQVDLVDAGGTPIAATSIDPYAATAATAVFQAGSVPAGVYDVVVSKPGGATDRISGAFTMTQGTGAQLQTNLIVPQVVGYHVPATIWVEYSNTGDAAMRAPLLVVSATQAGRRAAILALASAVTPQAFWTSALPTGYSNTVQLLASGATPGLLQPGESIRVPVQFAGWQAPYNFSYPPIEFTLGVLDANDTTLVGWASLKPTMQPAGLSNEAWDALWQNFASQAGSTWGHYVTMLTDNAIYLARLGRNVTDIGELLAFEFAQADALHFVRFLSGATDASMDSSGLPLNFSRMFSSSLTSRYELGALGRGWSHTWDYALSVATDGTVTVRMPGGSRRLFQPDVRQSGRYFSGAGDRGTLTQIAGGAFRLLEASGTTQAFHATGHLDHVEDPNGNRITATYSGSQLTSLAHSSGESLALSYAADGRLDSVTDSIGRATTYQYDASRQHLASVSYFDGSTLAYTYGLGPVLTLQHALTEIALPGGRHQYFSYDGRGRLASMSRDAGAEAVSFAYDAAGRIDLSDAFAKTSQVYLDQHGLVAKAVDPLGAATQLEYGSNFDLARVVDPAGLASGFSYDTRGRLTVATDAVGNRTQFEYAGPFDRMTRLIDAKGNPTSYNYDSLGNLLGITYADNSAESWTPDADGNPSRWRNRRGTPIDYQYDAAGRLTSKLYTDGTRVDYTYDSRGNLVQTVDPLGTTMLHYDAADRLQRITHPGARFLEFTYNAAGQRATSLDQLGHLLTYGYDAAGRLESLTDETNLRLVLYTYDAAGRLARKDLGNGVYTTYSYDDAGQLLGLINYQPGGNVLSQFIYTYDTRGRRTSMTTTEGLWTYQYDDLGQLTAWTAPDGQHVVYEYDAMGNRVRVIDDGVVTNYTTNALNQYTQVGTGVYAYDPDGNLTTQAGAQIVAWDVENRISDINSPTAVERIDYDAFGNRARTTTPTSTTHALFDLAGNARLMSEYDGATGSLLRRNTYGPNLISTDTAGSTPIFYSFDATGSTADITDSVGSPLASIGYSPFGTPELQSGAANTPYLFVGERGMRTASGILFAKHRAYSDYLGRFLSADPLRHLGGLNYYAYAGNSPVMRIDPAGLQFVDTGPTFEDEQARNCWDHNGGRGCDPGYEDFIDRLGEPYRPPVPRFCLGWTCVVRNIGDSILGGFCGVAAPLNPELCDDLPRGGHVPGAPPVGPIDPPVPPTGNGRSGQTGVSASSDPNEKTGSSGYGVLRIVSGQSVLSYRIDFENESNATAPAQIVTIADQLTTNLDWATFELSQIGFGDAVISVPSGSQYFETTVPITQNGVSFEVQIAAGIRAATGEVFAEFYSIDPATGLPPAVTHGFLPPEDGTGRGMGFVSYTAKPKPGLTAGTEVRNVANITFDFQTAIATNQVDPHDPSQGTDPNKEALNTIAKTNVTLTLSSGPGGSVTSPGEGSFPHTFEDQLAITALADSAFEFAGWSGETSTVPDVLDPSTSIVVYDDLDVTALFRPRMTKLLGSDSEPDDVFGSRVSNTSEAILSGAPEHAQSGVGAGAAYVFRRVNGNSWIPAVELLPSDLGAGDGFGAATSVYGDYALVGSPGDDDGGNGAGAAYLFRGSASGVTWSQLGKKTGSAASAGDGFGSAVAISQSVALVGASGDDENGAESGVAYVFAQHQGGSNAWGQVRALLPSSGAAGDAFGSAVSTTQITAVVGAPGVDVQATDAGAAYVFERDLGGVSAWGAAAVLLAADGSPADGFGTIVSIDGDTAIVGALANDERGVDAGAVYVFGRNTGGANTWGFDVKLTGGTIEGGDLFGSSIAVRGDTIVVGAPGDDDGGLDAGAIYVFRRPTSGGALWTEISKLAAPDSATNDGFGTSVAVDGDRLVVGSPRDDDLGPDSGSGYVFMVPGCADGLDNDGDGLFDFPEDPGCVNPRAGNEKTACQDGLDNDNDGKIDFDGGLSAGVPTPTAVDPQCVQPWTASEAPPVSGSIICGLGAELAIVLPLLDRARRRRRRAKDEGL